MVLSNVTEGTTRKSNPRICVFLRGKFRNIRIMSFPTNYFLSNIFGMSDGCYSYAKTMIMMSSLLILHLNKDIYLLIGWMSSDNVNLSLMGLQSFYAS
jgi:hypothetical protein